MKQSMLKNINLSLVPGHDGVRGNVRADRLAGTAAVKIGRAIDRSGFLNIIREVRREKNARTDYEYETLHILK